MAGTVKSCFVIAPIGIEGSDTRIRSDQVLKHIITPVAEECGYTVTRADKISEPGLITSQIIQHIVDDELVVADLTERNPNVFYELAIRHAIKKPVVQIIKTGEQIPFDVAGSRTIHVDHHDLDSVARGKEEIRNQIRAVESNALDFDTPISVAVELKSLRESDNPIEKSNAEIIDILQNFRQEMQMMMVQVLDRSSERSRIPLGLMEELAELNSRIIFLSEQEKSDVPNEVLLRDMSRIAIKTERLMTHLYELLGFPPPRVMRRRTRSRNDTEKE